jgi:uncharacterized protein (DUF3820 family)
MSLTDTDKMPYGIHKDKNMEDVPADYLLYLFDSGKCSKAVQDYVIENKEVLKKQANERLSNFKKD